MAFQDDLPLDLRLARAVSTVTLVTEPWPALSFLANADQAQLGNALPKDASPAQKAEVAIEECKSLATAAHASGIISSNEDLEEIATRNLRFLLVPYLAAQALQSWQGTQSERLEKLQECSQELQAFFLSMDRLSLLTPSERDRVIDGTPDAIRTPAQKREEKIARFKLEKAAEKRLQFLMERVRTREMGEDDEEGERECNIVVVKSAIRRALDLQESLSMELEILQYADGLRSRGIDPRERAERTRPRGSPPGMNGMPSTFRIVSQREEEREKVFRPSHSLPTYTVEEWGQIEAEQMARKQREQRENEITAKRAKEEEDSDGDEAVDRETMEARRWDDWKDDHNKGSGNTIR